MFFCVQKIFRLPNEYIHSQELFFLKEQNPVNEKFSDPYVPLLYSMPQWNIGGFQGRQG